MVWCKHIYSRSMNQMYPRKCLKCGQREPATEADREKAGNFDVQKRLEEAQAQTSPQPTTETEQS